MIDRSQLLSDLKALLKKLEKDLADRSDLAELSEVREALQAEYAKAQEAERTAQSYEKWRSGYATQVAVAWVLSAVFARFLEDNGLVDLPRLSGPDDKLQRARDEHEVYFREHPTETDREYLLYVFRELGQLPGMGAIFLEHNPIFELPNWLSGDATGILLRFFQQIEPETGELIHDFAAPTWDTRFLGDLYQDLSEVAQKQYALKQTPIFVEEFILDRTLDPAIEEFGLENFRMIDPACGSGHFLLGAFARILDRWQKKEPGTNVRALAQRVLDAVHGVDVNPYAIAIARFRLLLAAMKASEIKTLKNAPGFQFKLVCGDSLLHGEGSQLVLGDWAPMAHHFQTENIQALNEILRTGYYHAVVANPPYIVPKDRALNKLYRQRYQTCHMKYSLSVPFLERLFQLSVPKGFTGQITSNAFMKREFGKKVVESFLPKIDITHIVDTSLAYIPGHGTPTVILLGLNRPPVSSSIRTVMGIKREDCQPKEPAKGKYWQSILNNIDLPGSNSEYVSVSDSKRSLFQKHPWSMSGGGAAELRAYIEELNSERLVNLIESIGFMAIVSEDDAYITPKNVLKRLKVTSRLFIRGENIRDWTQISEENVIFPYIVTDDLQCMILNPESPEARHFWSFRTPLRHRKMFGKTPEDRGDPWYAYMQMIAARVGANHLIAFANVATHNQFCILEKASIPNQHAPVIRLKNDKDIKLCLFLTALLNSSVAAFWMRQVFHDKGGGGIGGGIAAESWERFFDYDGTKLKQFPIPAQTKIHFSKNLGELGQSISSLLPDCDIDASHDSWQDTLFKMISLQEEIDWQCYYLYGLLEEDLSLQSVPPIPLGYRAFEIVMARKMESNQLTTTWFDRHNSSPITEIPEHWPDEYKQLVKRRIELIKTNKNIRLIEQPQYKRRWNTESWESQLHHALEIWLLNRIESYFDFDGRMNNKGIPTAKISEPTLISTAKLADIARQDADFLQVGERYRNDSAFNVQTLIDGLIDKQTVPLLPRLRYKPSGLHNRADWENTWALQRQEDTIDARTYLSKDHPDYLDIIAAKRLKETEIGTIPVPPKYTTKDFAKPHYWKLRGKLDVPKERWVSFPHCEGPDGFPVIAWAGYNHLQLAQAISTYYVDVQERFGGRDDPRLIPLLGCLLELLPWLKQWHNELDPAYGLKMGDYYEGFIQDEARQMGITLDDIRAWDPPKKQSKRKRKTKK